MENWWRGGGNAVDALCKRMGKAVGKRWRGGGKAMEKLWKRGGEVAEQLRNSCE